MEATAESTKGAHLSKGSYPDKIFDITVSTPGLSQALGSFSHSYPARLHVQNGDM